MTKVPTASVGFGLIPIVGQFERWIIGSSGKKYQRESTTLRVATTHFMEPQQAEEMQRSIKVSNADHRVQVAHLLDVLCAGSARTSFSIQPVNRAGAAIGAPYETL